MSDFRPVAGNITEADARARLDAEVADEWGWECARCHHKGTATGPGAAMEAAADHDCEGR